MITLEKKEDLMNVGKMDKIQFIGLSQINGRPLMESGEFSGKFSVGGRDYFTLMKRKSSGESNSFNYTNELYTFQNGNIIFENNLFRGRTNFVDLLKVMRGDLNNFEETYSKINLN